MTELFILTACIFLAVALLAPPGREKTALFFVAVSLALAWEL